MILEGVQADPEWSWDQGTKRVSVSPVLLPEHLRGKTKTKTKTKESFSLFPQQLVRRSCCWEQEAEQCPGTRDKTDSYSTSRRTTRLERLKAPRPRAVRGTEGCVLPEDAEHSSALGNLLI